MLPSPRVSRACVLGWQNESSTDVQHLQWLRTRFARADVDVTTCEVEMNAVLAAASP